MLYWAKTNTRQFIGCNALLCLPISYRLSPKLNQMVTTTSPMLMVERHKEEEALEAIVDKQSAAPSWWPAAQGMMSASHYARIRQAEKVLVREERLVIAGSACGISPKHDVGQPSGQHPTPV